MPRMELFKTLVHGPSVPDYCRRSFVLEVGRIVDHSALERNVETIFIFKLIFKFINESYLLLNLRQIIYKFSLK